MGSVKHGEDRGDEMVKVSHCKEDEKMVIGMTKNMCINPDHEVQDGEHKKGRAGGVLEMRM